MARDISKQRAAQREWKRRNPADGWAARNPEAKREAAKRYRQRHPDRVRASKAARSEEQKAKDRAAIAAWARNNPGKKNAKEAKRRACLSQQTPAWADLKAIERFYEACPLGYHVDHIVPLRGKNVSGLHVLNNLQYLPALENVSKGNRYGEA